MAPSKPPSKSIRTVHPQSKPQGISKSVKQPRANQAKAHRQPLGFLDLPGEIGNEIYRIHCTEAEPKPPLFDLSKRSRNQVVVQDALAWSYSQVHEELTSAVHYEEKGITAYVEDFDFRHIVTFLNKLSDMEMHELAEGLRAPEMKIVLSFSSTFTDNDCGVEFALLDRWLNRLVHPTKKGTNIVIDYVKAPTQRFIREDTLTQSFRLRCAEYARNDPRRTEASEIFYALSALTI